MSNRGIFISFEGIDGAGKSSHLVALAESFRAQGRIVTVTREPGGTPLAEKLRAVVVSDRMDAMTEALLVFAARRDHIAQVIRPSLLRREVVLSDRFSDSSFAYQGGGQGLDRGLLEALEEWVQHDSNSGTTLQPDLSLWFDLPPADAAQRLAGARAPDKFEQKDLAFFQRVAAVYAQRASRFPDRFCRINAQLGRQAVWHEVQNAVRSRGWLS